MFIISVYIDNPKLYDQRKFNLRFYAMVDIKKQSTYSDQQSIVNFYMLNDVQVYFSILPYSMQYSTIDHIYDYLYTLFDQTISYSIEKNINNISIKDIRDSIHLTNLQIVKNFYKHLNSDIPYSKFISTLEHLNYSKSDNDDIKKQAHNIIKTTLDLIKNDIRPINRFVDQSSAFNLLAYDTMIDVHGKLHLIECNRGPDLNGLKITLGDEKITNIFEELFDIVLSNDDIETKYFTKLK